MKIFIHVGRKMIFLWTSRDQEIPKPPTMDKIKRAAILSFIVKSISLKLNIGSEFNVLEKIKKASRTEYITVRAVANMAKPNTNKFIPSIIIISKIKSLEKNPDKNGTPQRLKFATKKILVEYGSLFAPSPKARKSW